ncbi:MAG: hypothetical protein AAFO07_26030 [Bacteroidota bacterium]
MIAQLVKQGLKIKRAAKQAFWMVLIFYFLYLAYVSYACLEGWFDTLSLPPAILKMTTLPLLLFLLVVIFNLPIYKRILNQLALSDLVGVHIFRLIGSFFILLTIYGALPKSMGLIAGIGDVLIAISSIPIAYAIKNKSKNALTIVWIWNTLGLIDILLTSTLAQVFTKRAIETGMPGVEVLAQFPFCFIPAFAPATIIFLHLSIYRKLLLKN